VSRESPLIINPAEVLPGYRASIIDYANRIEGLFRKMDDIYREALPPNRGSIYAYINYVWHSVHALIAPVFQLQYEQNDPGKFISYLAEEEARLGNSLKRVHFIIDGPDTLTLVTGPGRIEKVSTFQAVVFSTTDLSIVDRLSTAVLVNEAPLRSHANHANQNSGPA
jgi:hypothetical protein